MLERAFALLFVPLFFACGGTPTSQEVCQEEKEKGCLATDGEDATIDGCVKDLDALQASATKHDCASKYDDFLECTSQSLDDLDRCDGKSSSNACSSESLELLSCVGFTLGEGDTPDAGH